MGTCHLAAAGLFLSLGLTACATPCPEGLLPGRTAELYFGRNIGHEMGVSDADWTDFVNRVVTPEFPKGLTVTDVAGQWLGDDGAVTREPSKVVMVVLTGADAEQRSLAAIQRAYMTRFQQEAVMLVQRPACVGFRPSGTAL